MNQEKIETHETSVIVSSGNRVNMFSTEDSKAALMNASSIAAADIIPYHYQNKPNNVLVAIYRSHRLNMDVFAYMEATYVVKGRVGHEAKFSIALLNSCGKFKGPIRYRFEGEIKRDDKGKVLPSSTRKCTAWAILKDDNSEISQTFEIQQAFYEGWMSTNPKWHNMTEMMMQYRSASFFGKMYAPEIMMGINTREELEDISDAEAIEQTETGRNIFEKGEDVNTAAEPVLDPTKEIKTEPVVATVVETNHETIHEKIHEIKEQLVSEVSQQLSEKMLVDSLPINPPEDIQEFANWFQLKFASESSTVDTFLVSKRWLKGGEGFPSLKTDQLSKLRGMWDKFLISYQTFKGNQK